MIEEHLRARTNGMLARVAGLVAWTGATPNTLTLLGFFGMAGAGILCASGSFFLAGVTVAASCIFDALDGALARVTGATSIFGAFFDSFLDRYAEAAVYAGLLVYYAGAGTPWGIEAAFAAAIGSLMVSYARARAEGLGIACRAGLFARPERLAVIIAGLVTGFILPALILLAVGTNATAVRRLLAVRGAAGPGP
ncbi:MULTISPECIES: CDP-alcohol phosphatidyltransferase family protein [unclassified Methanoculleus]|uniref:CDP-alcohol phosphatidyltransferase family protein n=1 Tax=unclassified Methanoculleus TaxID=2619537 RepID=UPI0025EE2F1B|nr:MULTISPECIES: CDP-alcohol phosphatidyltransferase family protein [unclassified Methanoculleus]MCK9318539.1 CDP-alcohol phosphatidyltransferase family protein [Methanoculleus sp.]MDD2254380.1 CDP-alcohol phosphatidyltransferase family protein [Methanoculleus sp.]MDD2787036.1 CDP-alcohol phosphatidyltransferase family protein [Methanoculleus sp.]MDD3215172.1 CDP-alcohol phosphatidyltransferase family protein [Methanoculleus sp.]MDD4314894.1 CDP-alcohol phosphatidyltransferase family protein [